MKTQNLSRSRRIASIFCPFPGCLSQTQSPTSGSLVRKGFYWRKSDGRKIARFQCRSCRRSFSRATWQACFRQKKRQINHALERLLTSAVPLRQCARLLGIHRTTVSRRLRFFGQQAQQRHDDWLQSMGHSASGLGLGSGSGFTELQFDELETFEHTKCKPVSVPLIVHAPTRLILGIDACSMPAKGPLAKLARTKYGRRRDERRPTLRKLLSQLQPQIPSHAEFTSDSHPFYPGILKQCFPNASHRQVISRAGCIVGQGELKKIGWDPLFSLNHTCAMLRAHISRLVRRTWCTTKKISALRDHLALYVDHHNRRILQKLADP